MCGLLSCPLNRAHFSDAALDFKTRLLHPNRAAHTAIAEKSYFVLTGALDRYGIRP